ncbi:MAG: cell envelope integrity protein CreD [Flavobacteriaceae bacterium]|nr:cell envelope integrity protein CreD [Flavobacteriaceae bacterium]
MKATTNRFTHWLRHSITARMLVVGFLFLILLIPLEFVKELIRERSQRKTEVTQEVNDKWGNEVTLSGPILKIPYNTYKEERIYNEQTKTFQTLTETLEQFAYVFPEALSINGTAQTKEKPLKRGIYEAVVFTTALDVSGQFPKITTALDIPSDDILWDKISLLINTSNLKGIRNAIEVMVADQTMDIAPKFTKDYLNTLQSDVLPKTLFENDTLLDFSFHMKVNGSQGLHFVPLGKTTKVSLESNWHSPSFTGRYLPLDGSREISQDGFKASWQVLQINREFEQVFYNNMPDLSPYAFGTELIVPVDDYAKSERTAKYGILVIGLTLLVFLLIQLASKIYIHPFQYVMIGLALVMFYTLLIAISEHSSFLKAYLIAGGAVLALITGYSRLILKGLKFPMLIAASLSALYGFIYVIIQLEDYALLVGSIGLFAILATIMFVSRKIDWVNES